jgi:hypothetical protein
MAQRWVVDPVRGMPPIPKTPRAKNLVFGARLCGIHLMATVYDHDDDEYITIDDQPVRTPAYRLTQNPTTDDKCDGPRWIWEPIHLPVGGSFF